MRMHDLTSLMAHNQKSIIFQCISGSHAYGTAHSDSDLDIRGVFMLPSIQYLSLEAPIHTISDQKQDTVYFSLFRFLQLAATANPNIIELLFMPEDCIQVMTPFIKQLIDNRTLFITQKIYDTHIGYAQAQLKKARGQNKWVNRPQPKERPKKTNFCWVVLQKNNNNTYPCRPIPLEKANIDPSYCQVASLEHAPNVYRLYNIGKLARGIFKNDEIICHSISKEEELSAFIGLFIFNKQAYESAIKDFHHYWQWRENRNEHRWINQEKGYIDYDAKNIMHMFRLLLSAKNILKNGIPIVRFSGKKLELLTDILSGKYAYNDLLRMAEKKIEELSRLKSTSLLPKEANMETINHLFFHITSAWEKWIEK